MTKYNNIFDKKTSDPVFEEIQETVVEETSKEEPKKEFVKVTANALYVRSKPSRDADSVMVVNKGAELMVTTDEGEWYGVVTPSGAEGYVMKEFVQ